MVTLRQIRSVVAVAEEGSFTRAADRENATQSGLSQHVAAVETALGATLFDRTPDGVRLTPAGSRYYARCIAILQNLEQGTAEARAASDGIAGPLRAGLMPAFTRDVLPPVLDRFARDYPDVDVAVIEGYSGALTQMVRAGELDFALVPAFSGAPGLKVTHLTRSDEMLVSGPEHGLPHGKALRLSALGPVDMIVPSRANVRRQKLDEYFATQGVQIARLMEMDTMFGTLGLVARSRWLTVLPRIICIADRDGALRRLHPLQSPGLTSDFVVIEPARQPIPPQARAFLERIRAEIDSAVATET